MFSYSEFKEFVKKDGMALQNRFYINIAMPVLSGESSIDFNSSGPKSKNLHLLCKSVSIPGVNIVSAPIRDFGETFEAPYDRTFGEATLSFYVDRQMYVRKFFDDWINTIQNPDTREIGYYKSYISKEVSVYVIDKMNRVTYSLTMYDAHPKSISNGLSLDQGVNDVMTIDVSLAFHYYKTKLLSQNSSDGQITNIYSEDNTGPSELYINDFFGFQNSVEQTPGALTTVGAPVSDPTVLMGKVYRVY